MIKPKKLQAGDRVATVTLSWGGPGTFPHRYEAGKRQLEEEFRLTVVEMDHTLRDDEWLHRNPEARAQDLMEAFADPSIKAIISTIGGDDSIRLLPYLDLGIIRSNPKIYMGYSDTTVTHLACFAAGLVSFNAVVQETDLWVSAEQDLGREARDLILSYRRQLEAYIR